MQPWRSTNLTISSSWEVQPWRSTNLTISSSREMQPWRSTNPLRLYPQSHGYLFLFATIASS